MQRFSFFSCKIVIFWTKAVWICSFFTFFLRTCHWLSRLIYLLLIIISTGYIFWWKIIGSGATSTSSTSMFPSALHREALRVSGKQNSLLLGINRLCSATFSILSNSLQDQQPRATLAFLGNFWATNWYKTDPNHKRSFHFKGFY